MNYSEDAGTLLMKITDSLLAQKNIEIEIIPDEREEKMSQHGLLVDV